MIMGNHPIDGMLGTTMEKIKCTKQSEKSILSNLSGTIIEGCEDIKVKGYEIHQGVTLGDEKNLVEGDEFIFTAKENLFATYIHGIFDNEKFTRKFLNNVRVKKGLELLEESFSFTEFKEREYDRLAKLLRENLDIDEIYNMMK